VLGAAWMVVMNRNDMERSGHGLLKVLFSYLLGGTEKDYKNPSQEGQPPAQEQNLRPPGWEAEMPTAVLLCHVP
jgi:hypothetical protein